MSLEIYIIVALSLTLLILLFVRHRKNEEHLKKALDPLQTQIIELKNLVRSLPQDNQIDALAERFRQEINVLAGLVRSLPQDNQIDALAEMIPQEINVLANIARRADELQVEIVRLEGRRLIAFSDSPPEISAHNPYWRDLSFWMRAKKQWTCENEECRINLEDRPSDLHVHHIRGRGYNSPQHLKVLCIACHAEEPGHAFMKAYPEYEAFLKWVKETQHK